MRCEGESLAFKSGSLGAGASSVGPVGLEARNQTIAVVILQETDALADKEAKIQFRGWQLQAVNALTGALEPMSEPVWLDAGIIFMNHSAYSSILHRPRGADDAWAIRFKPGGGTDLPIGVNDHWCLTLAQEADVARDAGALPPSSRTQRRPFGRA